MVAGCSGDLAGGAPDADTDELETSGPPDSDGEGTGGLTGGGGDETGAADDDGGAPSANDSDGLDCGPDQVLVGDECISCIAASNGMSADIPVTSFALQATFNGAEAPQSSAEDGYFVLRAPSGEDIVVVGRTSFDELSTTLLPGHYDLYWQHDSGGSFVPRNKNARLGGLAIMRDGTISVTGDEAWKLDGSTLVIDVPMVELSGAFLFNGSAAPDSSAEHGDVFLVDPATGDEVFVGDTRDGDFNVKLIPGDYEIHYRGEATGGITPANHDARVGAMSLSTDTPEPVFDIDIDVVTVSGQFMINDAPAPPSSAERGRVTIREQFTGEMIELGSTHDGSYSLALARSRYDVLYQFQQGGGIVPRNKAAVVATLDLGQSQATTASLDIDVPVVALSGTFTVGGQAPPTDAANVGEIVLRSIDGEDEVVLGDTSNGTYAVLVVPGDYEAVYRQKTSAGLVPINTNARLRDVTVTTGGTVDLDVPFAPVSGGVTLNGATPPASEYDDGRIYLRNAATGDSVLIGSTRLGAVGGLVVPGEYELSYAVEAAGVSVPQNAEAYLGQVTVVENEPLQLPVEISSGLLTAAVTVEGQAPVPSADDIANLRLLDTATGDELTVGAVADGDFAVPLTAGRYVLLYEAQQTTLLPANQRAVLGCYDLGL